MAKRQTNCKLCGKDSTGIKSHIIPKFFIKRATTDRISKKRVKASSAYINSQRIQNVEDSFFEFGLLCLKCEKILSKYEDNAAKTFDKEFQFEFDNFKPYTISIDLEKFPLFLLSIVWRASKSSDIHFTRAKLSDSIENQIKKMLINGHIDSSWLLPIVCNQLLFEGEYEPGWAGEITTWINPIDGIDLAHMIFMGCEWFVFLGTGFSNLPVKEDHLTWYKYGKLFVQPEEANSNLRFQKMKDNWMERAPEFCRKLGDLTP